MSRSAPYLLPAALVLMLAACSPEYSPNTYSANAVQQANKVEPGIIVGFRQVQISTNGTVGAVTGGAAGGVLGSQVGVTPIQNALGGVTGTAVGALVGTAVEHATTDTTGWEYIVRKHNGDLLSVTQREDTPLALGQKVLVITGAQARVIADYSVDPGGETKNEHKEETAKAEPKPQPAPPAPIIIIATPSANGFPTQLSVPNPDGGAPTIIPLPPGLGSALSASVPATVTAPLVKMVTPAPDVTDSSGTEPSKADVSPEPAQTPVKAAAKTDEQVTPEQPPAPVVSPPQEPAPVASTETKTSAP